jgi:hypothetical protein
VSNGRLARLLTYLLLPLGFLAAIMAVVLAFQSTFGTGSPGRSADTRRVLAAWPDGSGVVWDPDGTVRIVGAGTIDFGAVGMEGAEPETDPE